MTLGYGWAVVTILFLVTGFGAAWRKLEVPRINPLPVMTPWGPVTPAAPPDPELSKQEKRDRMRESVAAYFKTWALWVGSGQLVYVLSLWALQVAQNGTDLVGPVVSAAGWLGTVLLVGLGAGLVALAVWWLVRAHHRRLPNLPPPPPAPVGVAPHQQQQQMWTAPTSEHWERRP